MNLPSVEVTALRNWMNGTPRPEPDPPSAPQQQPAQTPNPPTHANNEPLTPTRCLTIDKRLPLTKPSPNQPAITSFYVRAPQAPRKRKATLTALPRVIPRNRPTPPAHKSKATSTTLPSAEPKKRIKETNQEALSASKRKVTSTTFQNVEPKKAHQGNEPRSTVDKTSP